MTLLSNFMLFPETRAEGASMIDHLNCLFGSIMDVFFLMGVDRSPFIKNIPLVARNVKASQKGMSFSSSAILNRVKRIGIYSRDIPRASDRQDLSDTSYMH